MMEGEDDLGRKVCNENGEHCEKEKALKPQAGMVPFAAGILPIGPTNTAAKAAEGAANPNAECSSYA